MAVSSIEICKEEVLHYVLPQIRPKFQGYIVSTYVDSTSTSSSFQTLDAFHYSVI